MNQIKFLKGKRSGLYAQPLSPGAIYFTEDERRLYIDTETARIPIAGDSISGKVFWVRLAGGAAWTDNQQTINVYYESKGSSSYDSLSNLLSEDSIIFIGKSIFGTADAAGVYPAIIARESNGSSITFQLYGTSSTISPPTDSVWIQIYCPNPKVVGYESLAVIKSVFTTRVRLDAEQWKRRNGDTGPWIQKISFTNIDFSKMPYLINLSDSSIENKSDFSILTIQEEKNGQDSYLVFQAPADKQPEFNIEADICIVLARGLNLTTPSSSSEPLEWVKVKVERGALVNGTKKIAVNFSNIPSDQERFFVSYCSEKNEDYSNITNIDYNSSTKEIVLNFKKGINEIKGDFNFTIIQLNNIATLHEATLKKDIVIITPIGNDSEGWQEYVFPNSDKKYYSQIWPASKDKTHILKNIHLPFIFPANKEDASEFSKIIETKVFNHGGRKQLQFVAKKLIKKDLPIIVADFI